VRFIDDLRANLLTLQGLLHAWVVKVVAEERPMWRDDGVDVGRANIFDVHGTCTKSGDVITLTNVVAAGDSDTLDSLHAAAFTSPKYLVTEADANLTAEVVVGATPGGELGGTWGTPTVDATHSGSAHSSYVAKSLFDAQSVLAATADDTPAALTLAEQTLVGRLTGGNVAAVSIGIADNNVVQIDDAAAADDQYARFTANGLESRSEAEFKGDYNLEDADINTLADAVADGLIATHAADDDAHQTLQPLKYKWPTATALTIASGAITVTQSCHWIHPEGADATDDLDTINGLAADQWYLFYRWPLAGHTVVFKNQTGNIWCVGNADISLDNGHDFLLGYSTDGTNLFAMSGDFVGPIATHAADDDAHQTLQPLKYKWPVATELTINTGAVALTQSHHTIDTEADAATDDLDTISGLVADSWYLLRPVNSARTIVVKHGTGNIKCIGNADIILDDTWDFVLVYALSNLYALVMGGGFSGGDVPGGQLGGTWASPTVKGLRETSGPTALTVGTITDGEFLKRVGATIVSAAGAAGSVATDTIWAAAGDLVVGTGNDTAGVLTKGTDAQVLTMVAGAVAWAAAAGGGAMATDPLWDAKGDLAGGTGANTGAKLTVGANDTMLMAASGETTGLKWANKATILAAINVEDGADVTDAANVNTAGAVMESDFDAQTILAATADNTPAAVTVAEQRIVGRKTGGNITALTAAEVITMLAIDSDDVAYISTTDTDWDSHADPGDVEQALDQLAERISNAAVFVPASAMWPSTVNGCAWPARREYTTNDVDVFYCAFDPSADEYAQFGIVLPVWDCLTVTATFHWTTVAAAGTTVLWSIQMASRSNDNPLEDAWGAAVDCAADTVLAAGDVHIITSGAITADTVAAQPTAGDFILFRVMRDVSADNCASDADLLGVTINYRRRDWAAA